MDTEIEEVKQEIRKVQQQIRKVQQQIDDVDGQLTKAATEADVAYWRIEKERLWTREEQLWKEKEQMWKQEEQLREKELLLLKAHTSESSVGEDNSRKWIQSMSLVKPELPCNKADVTRVLFPDVHGKLPVTKRAYRLFLMEEAAAKEYLEEADDSMVPMLVSAALYGYRRASLSEMEAIAAMSSQLSSFFHMLKNYSPHVLLYTLVWNCNEKTGDSYSDVTRFRSRPDTLCVASGRTLLIGEDKFHQLYAAEQDLRVKVKKLPTVYYGELEFILGYIAAGPLFQWVYVGKNGGRDLSPILPCLDLRVFAHRCKFYLSLGYAYYLLCSMVDAIPEVQSDRAMFSRDVNGDRTIDFFPESVRKSVKNFERYCELVETTVDAVRRAYEVAAGCRYLPQRVFDEVTRSGTYRVEYGPVGYPFTLRSEQDLRNMARCVCEALRVLHTNGLVHRDITHPNIVQISKDQFMLIDLESAATCPNRVPRFAGLRGWSRDTLDNGVYTEMSDMYQLGQLLAAMRAVVDTTNAQAFIQQLLRKNLSAELAMKDLWLSSPMP